MVNTLDPERAFCCDARGGRSRDMNWVKERDILISQTMAFVQSITVAKPDTDVRPGSRIEFSTDKLTVDKSFLDMSPLDKSSFDRALTDQVPIKKAIAPVDKVETFDRSAVTAQSPSALPTKAVSSSAIGSSPIPSSPITSSPKPSSGSPSSALLPRPMASRSLLLRPLPPARLGMREEIQNRVAAFRAHQQALLRERDAYFHAVLNKARSTAGDPSGNGRGG